MSYHTGGMGMRTTMANRAATQRRARTATRRTGRVVMPTRGRMNGNGRVLNGTGARGVRRTAGQFGRGGIRRATTQRPGPIARRGRTQPMMNRTQSAGVRNPGLGTSFGAVDGFGNNI